MNNSKQTIILLILDGWGYRAENKNNAINNANKPNWDKVWKSSIHTHIDASGSVVGLPEGQVGNSEVGHMNIGSGRIVYQEFTRINKAIKDGSFFENQVMISAIDQAVEKGKAIHILGLLSPGGVHAHEDHITAAIELMASRGAKKVFIHAFLDGRDTPPYSARASLKKVDELLSRLNAGCIVSISGRYYAMDRDKNWDRIKRVHEAITIGKADHYASSAMEGLDMAYSRGESDEFVKPTVISGDQNNTNIIANNDTIFFMNFRSDRARQLAYLISKEKHSKVNLVTLTEYSQDIKAKVVYKPKKLINTLGQVLERYKMLQLRIAETEKYAHVTFFFNGGRETPFFGEDRILIPSPKIKTYDLQPEMGAYEITENLVKAVNSQKYDVIVCNYANCDMVGHTGNYDATVKAIESLDYCLGRIIKAIESIQGHLFITADHGNADEMVDSQTGEMHTAHTNNPVPFIYFGKRKASIIMKNGKLSDIAPTILAISGLEQPVEMTGRPILRFK